MTAPGSVQSGMIVPHEAAVECMSYTLHVLLMAGTASVGASCTVVIPGVVLAQCLTRPDTPAATSRCTSPRLKPSSQVPLPALGACVGG